MNMLARLNAYAYLQGRPFKLPHVRAAIEEEWAAAPPIPHYDSSNDTAKTDGAIRTSVKGATLPIYPESSSQSAGR